MARLAAQRALRGTPVWTRVGAYVRGAQLLSKPFKPAELLAKVREVLTAASRAEKALP